MRILAKGIDCCSYQGFCSGDPVIAFNCEHRGTINGTLGTPERLLEMS